MSQTSTGPGSRSPITRDLDISLASVVGAVDSVIRRFHHVIEFDDDKRCVFRLEMCPAREFFTLSDGTRVEAGTPIGVLHFWNEQLLRFPKHGPDIRWAKSMLGRFRYSLEALCRYVEHEPGWAEVNAFCGTPRLPLRPNATRQLRAVAEAYGFEMAAREEPPPGRFWSWAEGFRTLSFVLAYNPAASSHSSFRKQRQCLWLSRDTLVTRYGPGERRRDRWEH